MSETPSSPETTLALILGASAWPHYESFKSSNAFRHSADDFRDYLLSASGLGLPTKNLRFLFDSHDEPADVVDQIVEFVRSRLRALKERGMKPTDIIVYYVGHGGFANSKSDFFLSLRSTRSTDPYLSSLPATSLAHALNDSCRHIRRYLVLDCCFAAAAYNSFQSEGPLGVATVKLRDAFPSSGTALLCASGSKDPAKAPANLSRTMFTEALMSVLREGSEEISSQKLSLQEIGHLVRQRILDNHADEGVCPEVHVPDQKFGRVDVIPLFPNTIAIRKLAATALEEQHTPDRPGPTVRKNLSSPAQEGGLRQDLISPETATVASPIAHRWKLGRAGVILVSGAIAVSLSVTILKFSEPAWNLLNSVWPFGTPGSDSISENLSELRGAAEQGDPVAQYQLGKLYENGTEVAGDYRLAAHWYRKSAEQGVAKAQLSLGFLYLEGMGVTKDYAEAALWLGKAADQGNPFAQHYLGWQYEYGAGVKQDYAQAVALYRKAAEQGNAKAQSRLGSLYERGLGIEKNMGEAVRLYSAAADQNYAQAQLNLALLYERGDGVSRDLAKAAQLYELAAAQGLPWAQYDLGLLYRYGNGVGKDTQKAIALFEKAANQGLAEAQNELGWLYEEGNDVTRDYTKASEWYQKAADQSFARAQTNLGLLYQNGKGVGLDYQKAMDLFKKAANENYAVAQANLGWHYAEAKGVERDYEQAFEWYRKAAEQGNSFAQSQVAWLYQQGNGVEQDLAESAKWYRKAAEQGRPHSQDYLGWLYEVGRGVEQSYEEAIGWYRKAAEQEYAEAQRDLGRMYQAGTGVPQDFSLAAQWYTKAADQGDANAQFFLAALYDNGLGVPQDYASAANWYREAAVQGDSTAAYYLGVHYERGLGVDQDYEVAAAWYQKSAGEQDMDAQYAIGRLYQIGRGVQEDREVATHWYKAAAAQGHELAQYRLDNCLDAITAADKCAIESGELSLPFVSSASETESTDTVATAPDVSAPKSPETFVIYFDLDQSNITEASESVLQAIADAYAARTNATISITGHTDRSGTEEYNLAKSLRVADSVREALIAHGLPVDAMNTAGRGESEPAVPTEDGVVEQANRRVEVIVQ